MSSVVQLRATLSNADHSSVNLFPEQNVVTARSEEAIISALYLVGLLASPELPPFI